MQGLIRRALVLQETCRVSMIQRSRGARGRKKPLQHDSLSNVSREICGKARIIRPYLRCAIVAISRRDGVWITRGDSPCCSACDIARVSAARALSTETSGIPGARAILADLLLVFSQRYNMRGRVEVPAAPRRWPCTAPRASSRSSRSGRTCPIRSAQPLHGEAAECPVGHHPPTADLIRCSPETRFTTPMKSEMSLFWVRR